MSTRETAGLISANYYLDRISKMYVAYTVPVHILFILFRLRYAFFGWRIFLYSGSFWGSYWIPQLFQCNLHHTCIGYGDRCYDFCKLLTISSVFVVRQPSDCLQNNSNFVFVYAFIPYTHTGSTECIRI